MAIRTTTTTVTFRRPFLLKGAERTAPAGDYRVVTDEELLEGLSFLACRRVMTAFCRRRGAHWKCSSSIRTTSIARKRGTARHRRRSFREERLATEPK
jgi:hypothetical protein